MKPKYSTYTVSLIFTLIATLLLCMLRTMALLVEFDPSTSYYNHDAVLPSIYMWGTFLIIAVDAALVFYMRSDLRSIKIESKSPVVIFIAALLGFVIVAGSLLDFFTSYEGVPLLTKIALAFSIPAALYCLIGISLPIGSKAGETVLSMLFALWLFFTLVSIYFDITVEVNNPNKVLTMATLAVALIFFISEARFRVSEPRPWLFTLAGFATIIFGGLYAVPNAILLIMNRYPDDISVTRELMILCIFAYTLARMFVAARTVGLVVDNADRSDDYDADKAEEDTTDYADADTDDDIEKAPQRTRRRHISEYDMYDDDDAESGYVNDARGGRYQKR